MVAYEGRSIAPQVKWNKFKIYSCLFVIAVIATPISILLFNDVNLNNVLMFLLLAGMVALLLFHAFKQPSKLARNKLIAFTCLTSIAIIFWTLYSLEPSFLSVFVQNNVDRHFMGMNIPAASFFAFDGVFVILLGIVVSRVWFYLSVRDKNPPLVIKFLLSLIIIGLGFIFVAASAHYNGNQPLPARYIVIAYAIFSLGELLVGPLGISMVGRLGPHGLEGLMMGFWQLSCGIGGVVAGYIAMAPKLPDQTLPLAQSNPIYIKVFFLVGLGAIIAGLIVALFAGKISKLMREPAQVVPQL
jgi:POT family proton-dependent oligopeptide transporter